MRGNSKLFGQVWLKQLDQIHGIIPSRHARLLRCIHLRHFSSVSSIGKQGESPGFDARNPIGTWLTSAPESLDPTLVLNQLFKATERHSTALFLVTPKLAHIFDAGQTFESSAVAKIFSEVTSQSENIRSIVAVVDALPKPSLTSRNWEVEGSEGISLHLSPSLKTLAQQGDLAIQAASICFESHLPATGGIGNIVVRQQIAPANTLFTNGRLNTMTSRQWRKISGEHYLDEISDLRQDLSQIIIPLKTSNRSDRPNSGFFHARLARLTAPAKIVSSMGNVIRQVETQSGQVISASHELESIVPPFLKTLQKQLCERTEVRVMALIYPARLCETFKRGGDGEFTELLFTKTDDSESEQIWGRREARLMQVFTKGARLHRVTSGGAGWGKSAGLLSLEARMQLESEAVNSTTENDTDGFESFLAGSGLSVSKDLFPIGHMVQFLASYHDPEGQVKNGPFQYSIMQSASTSSHDRIHRSLESHQNLVMGGSYQPNELERASENYRATTQSSFHQNFFGLLSVQPMALSTSQAHEIESEDRISTGPDLISRSELIRDESADATKGMIDGSMPYNTLLDVPNSLLTWSSKHRRGRDDEDTRSFAGEPKKIGDSRASKIFDPSKGKRCIPNFAYRVAQRFWGWVPRPTPADLSSDGKAALWLGEHFVISHFNKSSMSIELLQATKYLSTGQAIRYQTESDKGTRRHLLVRVAPDCIARLTPWNVELRGPTGTLMSKQLKQKQSEYVRSAAALSSQTTVTQGWNQLLRLCRGPLSLQIGEEDDKSQTPLREVASGPFDEKVRLVPHDDYDPAKAVEDPHLELSRKAKDLADQLLVSLRTEKNPSGIDPDARRAKEGFPDPVDDYDRALNSIPSNDEDWWDDRYIEEGSRQRKTT